MGPRRSEVSAVNSGSASQRNPRMNVVWNSLELGLAAIGVLVIVLGALVGTHWEEQIDKKFQEVRSVCFGLSHLAQICIGLFCVSRKWSCLLRPKVLRSGWLLPFLLSRKYTFGIGPMSRTLASLDTSQFWTKLGLIRLSKSVWLTLETRRS